MIDFSELRKELQIRDRSISRKKQRDKRGKNTRDRELYTGDEMRMPNMVHWSLKRTSRKE